jgi:zinc-ribbon domain
MSPKYCEACGASVKPDARFCAKCGIAIGGEGGEISSGYLSKVLKMDSGYRIALIILLLLGAYVGGAPIYDAFFPLFNP